MADKPDMTFRHRKFPRPDKGSALRPIDVDDQGRASAYREVVAWGGNAAGNSTAAADGATANITFTISEAGIAGNLIIMANAAVALAAGTVVDPIGCYVTSFKHALSELVTGSVPATLFSHSSINNPKLGHSFTKTDVVTCSVVNQSGAGVEVGACVTTM